MYASLQDMTDRFGSDELLHYAGDGAGGMDTGRIGRALADADAVIDRHLAGRYRLPLSVPDAGLTRIACDIARYALRGDETHQDATVALNSRGALVQLSDIARGVTTLQAAGVALPVAAGSGVAIIPGVPTFGGWVP